MNAALWLLIRLQLRGWLRYLSRNLRSVKGALLALVGAAVLLPWIAMTALAPRPSGAWMGRDMHEIGPALLLLYCFINVVFSSGERAMYFPPAEVNFLFPGPFSRRQLLVYKIASTLLVCLPSAFFLSVAMQAAARSFAALIVGMLLVVLFMQLFTMTLNLLAVSVGARFYTRGRRIVAVLALVLGATVLVQVGGSPQQWQARELLDRLLESPIWKAAVWPLRSFFDAIRAERLWPDFAQAAAIGTLVNLFLVGILLALDANYLEASATASARLYERMQRLRRGGLGSGEGLRRGGQPRFTLPMLPWLGGIGPIAWRQLTTALRGADRLLLLFIILGVAFLAPLLAGMRDHSDNSLLVLAPIAVWMTLFLTTLLPFDFRGDLDRFALLKSLPMPTWRLAVGQLLAPVLLMTSLQFVGLTVVASTSPPTAWLAPACWTCAAFVPPLNLLLFALDNLLFLLFPTRQMASSPGDFQALGRNVLLLTAKTIALTAVAFVAFLTGLAVYLLTSQNWPLAIVAAWPIVAVSAASLVPFVAWAFVQFDIGRDTPA